MILIVDDFRDGGEAMCRLISARGYPCEWIGGGPEALAKIRAHPAEQPLLVVLDEMMPDMSGTEILQVLRGDPATARTPVLFHSAGFDLAKRDEALTLGALAWLLKGGTAGADVQSVLNTIIDWYERVGGVRTSDGKKSSTPRHSE